MGRRGERSTDSCKRSYENQSEDTTKRTVGRVPLTILEVTWRGDTTVFPNSSLNTKSDAGSWGGDRGSGGGGGATVHSNGGMSGTTHTKGTRHESGSRQTHCTIHHALYLKNIRRLAWGCKHRACRWPETVSHFGLTLSCVATSFTARGERWVEPVPFPIALCDEVSPKGAAGNV